MSSGPMLNDEPLSLQEALGIVLTNWRDELQALLREGTASWGDWRRSEVFVHLHSDGVDIRRVRGNEVENIAELSREGLADNVFGKELSHLFQKHDLGRDVFIALPSGSLLRPRLTMPKARHDALKGALRYEIERISPIDPNALYYDFALRQSGADTVEVELRIVRKSLIDEAQALCRTAQLGLAGLYFEGDKREADWRSFPLDRPAFFRTLLRRYGFAALGGLAALLIVAALAGAYLRGAATLDALSDAVADAGVRAARVERLQQTIDRTSKDLAFSAEQKRSPLVIATLAQLTQILPDGTWITELTTDGAKVHIQGASPAASDLIGLIDHSRSFANAKFEAPLVHDGAANVDRFNLSFDVQGP